LVSVCHNVELSCCSNVNKWLGLFQWATGYKFWLAHPPSDLNIIKRPGFLGFKKMGSINANDWCMVMRRRKTVGSSIKLVSFKATELRINLSNSVLHEIWYVTKLDWFSHRWSGSLTTRTHPKGLNMKCRGSVWELWRVRSDGSTIQLQRTPWSSRESGAHI
jgi:hypothetical protein